MIHLPSLMQYSSVAQLNAEAAAGAVRGTVFVQLTQKTEKTTKSGKPYLELVFADVASSLSLKVWDNAPWNAACQSLSVPAAVALTGVWQLGAYGMEVADLECRPLSSAEKEILLTGSPELAQRQEHCWEEVQGLIASIQDPRLRQLCVMFLETWGPRFRRSGAARHVHHARRGGLVEHTAGVMRNAAALCTCYPELNRDLLLAGALFHDCGKMWENVYEEHSLTMPYSEVGELLGHITLGVELVNKLWGKMVTPDQREAWKTLSPATEQVRLHLLHLIAAHHGTLEFGSPVLPRTPEALALNHADDLDAKMEMFRTAYETSPALSDHVVQRKPPLAANLVNPLSAVAGEWEDGRE